MTLAFMLNRTLLVPPCRLGWPQPWKSSSVLQAYVDSQQKISLRSKCIPKLAELEAERAEVVANRETIAATVPPELLALYERQRDRYGVGASLLRGGVSSASGVALTGSDLAAVRAAAEDDVVLCPDSNAILVRTYESGI